MDYNCYNVTYKSLRRWMGFGLIEMKKEQKKKQKKNSRTLESYLRCVWENKEEARQFYETVVEFEKNRDKTKEHTHCIEDYVKDDLNFLKKRLLKYMNSGPLWGSFYSKKCDEEAEKIINRYVPVLEDRTMLEMIHRLHSDYKKIPEITNIYSAMPGKGRPCPTLLNPDRVVTWCLNELVEKGFLHSEY